MRDQGLGVSYCVRGPLHKPHGRAASEHTTKVLEIKNERGLIFKAEVAGPRESPTGRCFQLRLSRRTVPDYGSTFLKLMFRRNKVVTFACLFWFACSLRKATKKEEDILH